MIKCIFFLLLSNSIIELNARIISRNNGVSVSGRLNNNGLSSTVIKTQQLNGVDNSIRQNTNQGNQAFNSNSLGAKNDGSHFRLFYKSNSPGRSIKHEMEHRFFKNPNFLMNENQAMPGFQQFQYQNLRPNPLFNFNNIGQEKQPSNYGNIYGTQNAPNGQYRSNADGSTMFNLHYHDNSDYNAANSNNYNMNEFLKQQQIQAHLKQEEQMNHYQQARKNNLLKMMLMNFAPSSTPAQNIYQQPQSDSGVQYKVVNLKFKIEPQQGKFIGQGIVGTNNGAGNILNSQHFNLWPNELPALVRNILNTAQHHTNQPSFLKKKRQDIDEASTLDKRNVNSVLSEIENEESSPSDNSLRMKRSMSEDLDSIEENDSESKRSTDFEDIEGDNLERVDDNEFQESFKSLQRRDDEAEFNEAEDENSELDADRQERDFEEDTDETPVELNE